jgi:hypothetical protein
MDKLINIRQFYINANGLKKKLIPQPLRAARWSSWFRAPRATTLGWWLKDLKQEERLIQRIHEIHSARHSTLRVD